MSETERAVSDKAVSDKAVSAKAVSEPRQQVLNRLRRARGALRAVGDLVELGRACRGVGAQLAAVAVALDRAGCKIISENIQECITRGGEPGADGVDLPELEKLFLSLA